MLGVKEARRPSIPPYFSVAVHLPADRAAAGVAAGAAGTAAAGHEDQVQGEERSSRKNYTYKIWLPFTTVIKYYILLRSSLAN